MKNTAKRVILLFLSLVLVLSLAACGGDSGTESTTPNQGTVETPDDSKAAFDLNDYAIVYSNKISYMATEAVMALSNHVSDKFTKDCIPTTDNISAETAKEILIGETTRPESAEALACLTEDMTFVIKTIGEKIVINANDPSVMALGINYFLKLCRTNGFKFGEEINYISEPAKSVTLFDAGKTNYVIAYPNELDDSISDGSDKRDFEVETALSLVSKIKNAGGPSVTAQKDNVKADYMFVVGYSSLPESVEFVDSLGLAEYGFEVVGNKVIISGTNTTTTRLATELFVETLKQQSKGSGGLSVTLLDGTRVTKRSTTWNTDIPEYEGGERFGTLNAGNKAFGVCYEKTNAEEFEAYCKKLESEGYTLWQRHDIEDNLHATYTHETRGLIHVYFTGNEENVRIISYRAGTYNLPTNPERYTYESVTKTAITQYALDRSGGAVGMGYVITLEDGSFIVVDGGTNNDAGTMQKEFYELLKSLNKRPDGKIVIKAWYNTHEHGDHTQAFRAFMRDYGSKITIEELWCNPASSDYSYHGDSSAFGTMEKNYKTYKSQINGDFKWINLHTGMEFYAANMKFEVLYTEEDFFPRTLFSGNDTCLVMKMTDVRSGQTTIWMGDTLLRGCQVLSKKYDGYLKADILQVAHHGKSEALPVYQQMLPTVAMWSCTTSMKKSQTTSSNFKLYWDTNKFLDSNVPVHITSDATYTIYLPYKQGDRIVEWKK